MRGRVVAVLCAFAAVFWLFSEAAFAQTRTTISVAPVTLSASAGSPPSGFRDVVRREIQLALERTRLFSVIVSNSSEIDALLAELARSGRQPPRSVGADYVYAVEIASVSLDENISAAPHMVQNDLVAIRGAITLNVAVLSPTRGLLTRFSVDAQYRPTPQLRSAGSNNAHNRPARSQPVSDSGQYQELARAAAARIAGRIMENNNAVRVVEVQGDRVWINRGSQSGYAVDEVLTIRSVGRELTDPVTGERLGDTGSAIARIRLSNVEPLLSIGVVVDSTAPIEVGAIVRRAD